MSELKKVDITLIDKFKNHPYKVIEDESLNELVESINNNGLLNPLIVREKENNRYELISGHRRKLALEKLSIKEVEVDIRDLSDDEATILMVDSNLARDKILPSEKAFAYKMKMDAIKHQGKTLSPQGTKNHSVDELPDTKTQIYRYIRLTYLVPELRELVDNTVLHDKRTYMTMGLKPAVEISYLTEEEQNLLYVNISYNEITPSHAQAIRLRELSKNHSLEYSDIEEILTELKGNQKEQISFNKEKIEKALPEELLKRDKRYIEEYVINAIECYKQELERGDAFDLE